MQTRRFGRTEWSVSEIGFGTWPIGSAWGPVKESESIAALHEALDRGVNFIDTADVYGDHTSELLIARVLKERKSKGESCADRRHQDRPAPARTTGGLVHLREPSAVRGRLPQEPVCRGSRPRATALPSDRNVLPTGGVRGYGPPPARGEASLPWRQRREGRGRAQGARVSRRGQRPNHLQHVPPAPRRPVPRAGAQAAGRGDLPGASGERHADGQVQTRHQVRPQTTIASSTATARRSMSARPSRACPTTKGSPRSRKSGRLCPPARPWRRWPCAGCSCTTPCRWSFPARRIRTRLA